MNIEKMREEFENFGNSVGLQLDHHHKPGEPIVYFYRDTHFAWLAWQASRKSLVIELPKTEYAEYGESAGRHFGVVACREAIHAAGVKTK